MDSGQNKIDNNDSIFVKCDCCCSTLEFFWDPEENKFEVSVWILPGSDRPLSQKERKRWCDHIMKTGKPWADHTILSPQNAQQLADYITNKLTYAKDKKSGSE